MPRFFNNIRKGLLRKSRFSKYLLYAIGEIILVVIGILIALQVNAWNQTRKDRHKEVAYLERLDAEIDVILDRLKTGVEIAIESSKAAELLIQTHRDYDNTKQMPADSLLRKAVRNLRAGRVPAGSPAAFKEMVSSGELNLIQNADLRNALFKYDEFSIIARDVWRGGWQEFLTGYPQVMAVIQSHADFTAPANETYSIVEIDYDRFFKIEGMESALNIILGSKVNHYEVLKMQLEMALEVERLLEDELSKAHK